MDKTRLIRNFSRSALFYDTYANMQKRSAKELLDRVGRSRFERILELGCGTGNYSSLLNRRFAKARLTAVDLSREMIRVAEDKLKGREIEFLVADAQEIRIKGDFDLITSNACFQWFEDLERPLIRYKKMLKQGGLILFSVFGPLTFEELRFCVEDIFEGASLSAARFITKEKIASLLSRHFTRVEVEEKTYQETSATLGELLKKIKYTGAIGDGFGRKVFLSPGRLKKLETVYRKRFGAITATYQVFMCRGQKP